LAKITVSISNNNRRVIRKYKSVGLKFIKITIRYMIPLQMSIHIKNDFAEISKNLARDTDLKIILLDH